MGFQLLQCVAVFSMKRAWTSVKDSDCILAMKVKWKRTEKSLMLQVKKVSLALLLEPT